MTILKKKKKIEFYRYFCLIIFSTNMIKQIFAKKIESLNYFDR